MGLGCLLGVSFARILYPGSKVLNNIWLYGGLVLYSAYILYDTQKIIKKAKTKKDGEYDPILWSLGIYMDAMLIFKRLVKILGEDSKKK